MNARLRHGDYRIARSHEVGSQFAAAKYPCREHQVTTGREAHDPHPAVTPQLAYLLNSLLNVLQRHGVLVAAKEQTAVGDEGEDAPGAVLQYVGGNASLIQRTGHAVALGMGAEPEIAAPRANDNSRLGRLRRQELPQRDGWQSGREGQHHCYDYESFHTLLIFCSSLPCPMMASTVLTAVSGTPQMPCRLTFCPVSSRFFTLVQMGSCESMMFWQSLRMP